MLLYKPTTSSVKSSASGGRGGSACRPLIKSFVSLTKDGRDWTMGLSWMSTKALILSVGARVELTTTRLKNSETGGLGTRKIGTGEHCCVTRVQFWKLSVVARGVRRVTLGGVHKIQLGRVIVGRCVLVDSGNPGHLVVEKELTAWWKSKIHTQFPLWLRSSVVRAYDKNSQDPGFDSRRGCAVFFRLIRLSVLLSLSELKEKRIWVSHALVTLGDA